MHRSDVRSAGGFTLLEVIVALAITGFVLAGCSLWWAVSS